MLVFFLLLSVSDAATALVNCFSVSTGLQHQVYMITDPGIKVHYEPDTSTLLIATGVAHPSNAIHMQVWQAIEKLRVPIQCDSRPGSSCCTYTFSLIAVILVAVLSTMLLRYEWLIRLSCVLYTC